MASSIHRNYSLPSGFRYRKQDVMRFKFKEGGEGVKINRGIVHLGCGITMPTDGCEKGLMWKLPELRASGFGKLGPAFAVGIGCGAGFGLGLFGGAGTGPGIPGLHLGFGVGVGCGVGLGFGYGIGKGIAYDENGKHSNVGRINSGLILPSQEELGAAVDELAISSRKLMTAASKKIKKLKK